MEVDVAVLVDCNEFADQLSKKFSGKIFEPFLSVSDLNFFRIMEFIMSQIDQSLENPYRPF